MVLDRKRVDCLYVSILTYGHKLYVVTEQNGEMISFRWCGNALVFSPVELEEVADEVWDSLLRLLPP